MKIFVGVVYFSVLHHYFLQIKDILPIDLNALKVSKWQIMHY